MHNAFDGRADVVVQAGQVQGGVHIHGRRPREAPRLVPPPTPHFTNQLRVLAEADAAIAGDGTGPRILVLSGPPGVGKREAVRFWLSHNAESFPDGQFHADLSAGAEQDGLCSTKLREFLLAADVDPAAIPDTAEGRAACFRSWSTGKRVAVSVDMALAPRAVRMLCPGPGASVVVVTAAGSLGGLSARDSVTFIDLSPLEDEAAQVLLGRLTGPERIAAEPEAVRSLLELCAGLPIALCVAGAMIVTRSKRPIARLVAELADERRRLAALSRDEDLSVVAVFSTAYQRLSPAAQRCYRAFGTHPGAGDVGIDVLVASGGLVDSQAGDTVRDAVDELRVAGLVDETGDERHAPHSLIRLHAADMAAGDAEHETVLGRMLEHYLRVAVAAGHGAMPWRGWLEMFFADRLAETAPAEPMRLLEAERENLLAVLEVLFARGRLDDVCLLAVALWPVHERGKYFDDLISVNRPAVDAALENNRPDLVALLTTQLGFGYLHRGDVRRAYKTFQSAVVAAQRLDMLELEATAVESMGLAAVALGDTTDAEALLRRNLELAERIGGPRRRALARLHLAKVTAPAAALGLLDAALRSFRELDPVDKVNAGKAQLWLGQVLTTLGRFDEAGEWLRGALEVMRAHNRPFDQAQVLEALGDLARGRGDAAAAVRRYRASLALTESCGFVHEARRVAAKSAELGDVEADVEGDVEIVDPVPDGQ